MQVPHEYVELENGIKLVVNIIYIPMRNKSGKKTGYCIADYDDYDMLKMFKYHKVITPAGKVYVMSNKKVNMHELVMGAKAPLNMIIDHDNSNGLDNRRSNLKYATLGYNAHNRVKKANTSSIYIGVTKDKGKWVSSITYKHKFYRLGRFVDEREAARAYDFNALLHYGKHANINKDSDGNFLLTDEEIQLGIEGNLPDKYIYKGRRKTSGLPTNIKKRDNKYYFVKEVNKKYHCGKRRNTIQEAVRDRDVFIDELKRKEHEKEMKRRKNIVRNKDGIAIIKVLNGKDVFVDDHIWGDVSRFRWQDKEGYAQGRVNRDNTRMHVYIYVKYVGPIPDGKTVDHIESMMKHDNRLGNLRALTAKGQSHNRKKNKGMLLKYKGVHLSGKGSFVAQIDNNYLGAFKTEEKAAEKFNEEAIKIYGENARLNKITTKNTTTLHYFNDETITLEFIQNMTTVVELREVYRFKKEWWDYTDDIEKINDIKSKIKGKTFDDYKNIAIDLLSK